MRRYSDRRQYFATYFLRNRSELELLQRIVARKPQGSCLNVTIFACSKGAEAYSIAWAIRSIRLDLDLHIHAVDIAPDIVEFASRGIYSIRKPSDLDPSTEDVIHQKRGVASIPSSDKGVWIFDRMSPQEIEAIFEVRGDEANVRDWLREGITWQVGDASDPELIAVLGPQDIVVANRFLCHMVPHEAEKCLRNLDRFVKPGGYLFVSGVDFDVRSKIAVERGWSPLTELLREVHQANKADLPGAWPLSYWGVEPLDDSRPDWQTRYASVFQVWHGVQPNYSRDGKNSEYIREVA